MSEPPDAHYPQWYVDKIKSIPAADVAPVVRARTVDGEAARTAPCFTAANAGSSTHGRRIMTFAATEKR